MQYTAAMPVDVAAEVIANHPLSADYNVLTLRAPEIARTSAPGQFVMVKAGAATDPLLRRPFSVFELLRDEAGRPSGLSLLNKRIGPSTALVYSGGARTAGRLPGAARPPVFAGRCACRSVDGRRRRRAGAVRHAGRVASRARRPLDAVLRWRQADGSFSLELFRDLEVDLTLTTEDGSAGERGRVTGPLEQLLSSHAPNRPIVIYACGPEGMLAATAKIAMRFGRPCQVSVERIMGCGLGGCYSCVVPMRDEHGGFHHVRSCLSGPVLAGSDKVGLVRQLTHGIRRGLTSSGFRKGNVFRVLRFIRVLRGRAFVCGRLRNTEI